MVPRADLILANRSYLDHAEPPGSQHDIQPVGGGGLLEAVRPAIAPSGPGRGTTWVGAARGPYDRAFTDSEGFETLETGHGPLRHRRLYFSDTDWALHYAVVANNFTWPLFHLVRPEILSRAPYFPIPATPSDEAWEAHRRVNLAFARAALAEDGSKSCWVHDYQLTLVPGMMREGRYAGRIGFFLHTPFPLLAVALDVLPADGVARLRELVAGILAADLAGFQSDADEARFHEAAQVLCGARPAAGGLELGGHVVRLGVYPVGIDADDLVANLGGALPASVAAAVAPREPLVVGLEREDYTKGIPERLATIARMYRRGVAFSYVGLAQPTRRGVESYGDLQQVISRRSDEAREAAAARGTHFEYVRQSIPWEGVLACQREANVVFTSSLADGMNLVPLQSIIAQSLRPPGQRAAIIAGCDTGVAHAFAGFEDEGLVPVDPLDPQAMDGVLAAAVAGELPGVSDRLVAAVRDRDAQAWATSFLTDLQEGAC